MEASADANQDLFRALKGGGNNFGTAWLVTPEQSISHHLTKQIRHRDSVHLLHLPYTASLGRDQDLLA